VTPERYARVKELFLAVCEQEPDTGARFLDEACGSDAELRREVEALVACCDGATTGSGGEARSPPMVPLQTGDVFAERYRIVSHLGEGGMGEVYRTDDLTLGVPVALKLLRSTGPRNLERLRSEVRLAREVSHSAVCRVFDVGEADGRHFLTMEYIEGEDLAIHLRRMGRLPAPKVLELSRELCAGLAAAHERGILHRDLKPANIMVDARGHARITDFGIAISVDRPDHLRIGTPAYMAPEQLAGGEVTEQTDLYSLGVLLYELVTGRLPFQATTLQDQFGQRPGGHPEPPSSLVTGIDPRLERLILQALAKRPEDRPASAQAMAAALQASSGAEASRLRTGLGIAGACIVVGLVIWTGTLNDPTETIESLAPPGESLLVDVPGPQPSNGPVPMEAPDGGLEAPTSDPRPPNESAGVPAGAKSGLAGPTPTKPQSRRRLTTKGRRSMPAGSTVTPINITTSTEGSAEDEAVKSSELAVNTLLEAAPPALASVDSGPAGARDVVSQTVSAVLEVLRAPGISTAARLRQIEHIAYARFDFETMCRLVLKAGWNRFSTTERVEFIRSFEILLAQRYSSKIEAYEQEDVEIYEIQEHSDGDVTVRTKIVHRKAGRTDVDYRMRATNGSTALWRVIDVHIDGVGLVSNYREQFASILADRRHEDLLIEVRRKIHNESTRTLISASSTDAFEATRKALFDAWGPWQEGRARVWVDQTPVRSDGVYRVEFAAECDCDVVLFAIHDFTDEITLLYSSTLRSGRLASHEPRQLTTSPAPEIREFGGYGRETLKLFVTARKFDFPTPIGKQWVARPSTPARIKELDTFLAGLNGDWDSAVAYVEVVR
jgi:serine/threonine protein kinase/ABC-type transporter MlaC component